MSKNQMLLVSKNDFRFALKHIFHQIDLASEELDFSRRQFMLDRVRVKSDLLLDLGLLDDDLEVQIREAVKKAEQSGSEKYRVIFSLNLV